MPLVSVLGYRIPALNFDLSDQYWPELTTVAEQHGSGEVKEASAVINILRECFNYLESKFMALINGETRVSFYAAVHKFHENTLAIWMKQQEGASLPIDGSDFAAVRRVLKLILEQGCANDLQNSVNYNQELVDNLAEYVETIEHLLYLGYWANGIAGYITRVQLFPGAIGILFDDQGMDIVRYEPFASVFDYVEPDFHKHGSGVVLQSTVQELKDVFKKELGIDYDHVTGFVANIPDHLVLVKPEALFELLLAEGYNPDHLASFFAGLTVSRANKLSFEDCIIRAQDIRRYLYRPILSLQVEGTEYWLMGANKWVESLHTLTTNAIPFGVCPDEWLAYKPVNRFINQVKNGHDKVLEQPLVDILKQRGFLYEANVKAIQNGKQTISLIIKGLGEIDLLFIDPQKKVLYVGECKHIRAKYDAVGWRRDYQHFVRDYEPQLTNKVAWATQNLAAVAAHFSFTTKRVIDLAGYQVEGIFVINAPTIYLYDGAFRTFTISTFRRLVNGHYREYKIRYTPRDRKPEHLIGMPYFKNAAAIMAAATAAGG